MSGNVTTLNAAVNQGLGIKPAQTGTRVDAMTPGGGGPPVETFYIELEDGSGFIELEDGSGLILLESAP